MDRVLAKVLLLLAGSGLSHKEIREVMMNMQDYPPSQLADAILQLRREVPDRVDLADSILVGGQRPRRSGRPSRPDGDVRRRVEFLLREEAGLTVNQAASELVASLKREDREISEPIRLPNKESLYNWLQNVLQRVGASELLHHATRVRNKYVHHTDVDWPLRPR